MNESLKRSWIEALRSGQYKQKMGQLCLLDEKGCVDGYCSLGVLMDLISKDPKYEVTTEIKPGQKVVTYTYKEVSTSASIPTELVNALDLPNVINYDMTLLNDARSESFTYIADFIEKAY